VARAGSLSWPALLAWILYTAGLLLTFEGLGHIAILNGFGEVGWDKVIRIATSTAGFLASWWILHHRGGLGGLGAVFLMQGAILLLFALVVSRRRTFRTLGPLWPALLPRGLLSEGAKLLALAGAGYVVSNSGFIVIEKTFGLEFVARYSALTRVGMVLASASALLPQMIYPYAARAWTGGDVSRFRKLYWSGLAGAMAACLTGAASVWLLSDQLFPRWLGPANYLGAPVLLWVLLYQVVCVHHMSHCTPVLAAAGNAFILPALFNAILVPPCVHWACRRWGIIGVPAGTLLGTIPPSIWVVVICLRFVLTARPKA
jgi:O-antigen/teichoic acid export membrane protein